MPQPVPDGSDLRFPIFIHTSFQRHSRLSNLQSLSGSLSDHFRGEFHAISPEFHLP
jgi:hypothetical protein